MVPIREQMAGGDEYMLDLEVLGVRLAFLDEAHVRQDVGIFERGSAEYLDVAAGVQVLSGQYLHDRGLACAVTSEQAVDFVLADLERDVRERIDVPVASVHCSHRGDEFSFVETPDVRLGRCRA